MSHSDEIARRNKAARDWEQPRFVSDGTDPFAAKNLDGVLAYYAPDTWSNMGAAGNVALALSDACQTYVETVRGTRGETDGPLHLDMFQQVIREANVVLDALTADTHDDDDEWERQCERALDALNGHSETGTTGCECPDAVGEHCPRHGSPGDDQH